MVLLIMSTTMFMVNIMGHTRTKQTDNRVMEFNIVDAHYVQPAIYHETCPRNKRWYLFQILLVFHKHAIFLVESFVLVLKTQEHLLTLSHLYCNDDLKSIYMYLQWTHACMFLNVFSLDSWTHEMDIALWIVILNWFSIDTLPISRSERMRT